MEVTADQPLTHAATKRRLVSATNTDQDLPSAKRLPFQLDDSKKKKVHKFLAASFLGIAGACQNADQAIKNIHLSQQILSTMNTAHNILRQKANNTGNLK